MDFLKNNKRFSFKIDNKNVWETDYKSEIREDKNSIITTYSFGNGLKVTNISKKYEKYGAYEWVNYIENTSDMPTDIISELWDCDCSLPMEHEDEYKRTAYLPDMELCTKIYAPSGSTPQIDEFCSNINETVRNTRVNQITPGNKKTYSPVGGRSSEGNAPFFNVHKNGRGYIFAIGWTGQWNCEIGREEDALTLKSKIEDTNFRVMPGEKFRTSSVVIMPYEGDVISSQNKWRRLVKEEFSLIGKEGRASHGPLCTGIWGGTKSCEVIKRIEAIKENKLPFEYIWMDAGWCGINSKPTPDEFEGDWHMYTGDWRVSPLTHPNGLRDVSDTIHNAGMKFVLWFEPERVIRTTPIALEHPEYFISDTYPESYNKLLNLGNPDAWHYCFNAISKIIEEVKVDCYRQDFNFRPLDLWRKNDAADRIGITEIKHINGLYKFWDALLEKFPNIIIDNCAGGGKRIDIETLRRSIPLWRSDYQCPANFDIEGLQCHHMNFNAWMPYSGSTAGRDHDEYRTRSAYESAMSTNYLYSERDAYCDSKEKVDFIRKYTEEYLRLREYFSEDFYPLTEHSDKTDTWCAAQFDRPEKNDGILQVFRRETSPYESASFKLRGIDENKNYLFMDIDGGEFIVSGKELMDEGAKITIPDKRTAKIYVYKSI